MLTHDPIHMVCHLSEAHFYSCEVGCQMKSIYNVEMVDKNEKEKKRIRIENCLYDRQAV